MKLFTKPKPKPVKQPLMIPENASSSESEGDNPFMSKKDIENHNDDRFTKLVQEKLPKGVPGRKSFVAIP